MSDRTTGFLAANLIGGLFSLAAAVPFVGAWAYLWPLPKLEDAAPRWLLAFVAVMVVTTIFHELIHALVAAWRSGRGFSVISFGFRKLTPFVHYRVPLSAGDYRLTAIAPGLLLGVLPSLVAVIIGAPFVLAVGLANLFGMGGDLLVLWLLRDVPASHQVQDHPTLIGCTVEPPPPEAR